jgi:Mannose-6-phosphate isomerase
MEPTRKTKRILENPIYKDKAVIIKTSRETDGAYSLGELEIAPGGGNGLHKHSAFTETFTAIKGRLGVMYGKKKLFLNPGESLTIPLKTPHYFFNDNAEKIICQVKLQPGHEGFEKGIAIAYGLAVDGSTNQKGVPRSFTHLSLIVILTDTIPSGVLSFMMPLFRHFAKKARRNGIENELLEKYYYE